MCCSKPSKGANKEGPLFLTHLPAQQHHASVIHQTAVAPSLSPWLEHANTKGSPQQPLAQCCRQLNIHNIRQAPG